VNNYAENLSLTDDTGSINGLLATISNRSLTPPSDTTVRIETSKHTLPGRYTMVISATDGTITKTITLPLTVTENSEITPGLVTTPGPGPANPALVTLFTRECEPLMEFTAFTTRFGANAVMGDVDADGEDEIIVAPGPDPKADAKIRIYRRDGTLVSDRQVFSAKYGLTLAVGDIDGDWKEEIVLGMGPGPQDSSRIKVFSVAGNSLMDSGIDFTAFPEQKGNHDDYRYGANLALGDVDGDGFLEIIIGAGPSPQNSARVRAVKLDTTGGAGKWSIASTYADFVVDFGNSHDNRYGVNVAAGDIDGDGVAEIITGPGPGPQNSSIVRIYEGDGTYTGTTFEAYPGNKGYGVFLAARDLNGDGTAEIITGPGPSPQYKTWVRIFNGNGTLLSNGFYAYPDTMRYGVKVATGNVGE